MKKYKKNIIFQYGLEFARYFFPFITIPILARAFGPDTYAIRAYVLAAMTFVQVFLLFGFNSYATREIALNNDNDFLCRITSNIVAIRLLLCMIAACFVSIATLNVPILSENPIYVLISFLGVCFKCCLPDFVFQGKEDMGIITNRFVVSQIVSTILIVSFVNSPGELLLVPVFEGLASLIAFLWSWKSVSEKYNVHLVKVTKDSIISVLKESGIFFISNASTTIFSSLTTLLIGVLIPNSAEVSYWAIAMTAITAIQALYSPITNSIYPHICRTRDFKLLKKILLLGSPVVLVGTIVYAALSEVVMGILGGAEYIPGSYVVTLTSPVLLFSFYAMMLGFPTLAAVGEIKQLTKTSVYSAFFHIVGLFVLAISGYFTLGSVSLLRCCTELLMAILRAFFAFRCIRGKQIFKMRA